MKRNVILLLLGILCIAALLRFWALGSNPPSPDWDEAALGYNAYSILQTGKDEYGKSFPIILQSFGDYKPALYTYLAVPSIAAFGVNTFAVRLPSAIFGLLAVLGVFLLLKEFTRRDGLALTGALVLALSPWHIQFSRVAFETNIGVSLTVFAALFFLYGLRKNIFLFASAFCLGLDLYAYQSEKLFAPLFALCLVLLFFKKVRTIKIPYLAGVLAVGLIISLPMIASVLTDTTTLQRAQGVSVFNQRSVDFNRNIQKLSYDHATNDTVGLLLDNRRVFYAKQILENYLSHWNLNWLFIKGDIGRHHAPGMGLLYLVELPFLFIGIFALLFGVYPRQMKQLFFFWLLLAPIPASLTIDVPHAVRAFHMIPVMAILVALGMYEMFVFVRHNHKIRKYALAVFCLFALVYLANIGYYLNQYFVQLPYYNSQDWQYGYQQTVTKTQEFSDQYDTIVVSNEGSLDQSYIFYLFYLGYPPSDYQKNMSFINNNQTDRKIGKYEFRPIDWQHDRDRKRVLYIGMPKDFPSDYPKKTEIHFLDGKPAIDIVGT